MNIKEDAPVTTTDNNGAGMVDPKLPIKPLTTLRRVKDLIQKNKKTDENQ